MQSLTIHTENVQQMDEVIVKLNQILQEQITKAIYTYSLKNDVLKDCHWENMPEYKINETYVTSPKFIFYIEKEKYKLIQDHLHVKIHNKSFWYPSRPENITRQCKDKVYISPVQPKYPIYIISKGRWERRLTSKYLESANIPYKIVVEPQEYENYAKYIDPAKILILPAEYCNLNSGSIPARNFCLFNSRANGDVRHWILDDNIMSYKIYNNSEKVLMKTGAAFRILEDYVDRYDNIMMAGHNYTMFAITCATHMKVITKNTRIYSSILLHNDIPFEWRGKYNEDTDLSLRILKAGFATVLFNNILADKAVTMREKGGNTDTIYQGDGILLKTQSLIDQHPDVTKMVNKFGRVHHSVNYSSFKKNSFGNLQNYMVNDYELQLLEKEKQNKIILITSEKKEKEKIIPEKVLKEKKENDRSEYQRNYYYKNIQKWKARREKDLGNKNTTV